MEIPSYLANQGDERFIELLTQTLQGGVSDNGFLIPAQEFATIAALANMYPPVVAPGTLWFDTDLNKLVVMTAAAVFGNLPDPTPTVNAVLEEITSVPIAYVYP
jgi:hypothetical protein